MVAKTPIGCIEIVRGIKEINKIEFGHHHHVFNTHMLKESVKVFILAVMMLTCKQVKQTLKFMTPKQLTLLIHIYRMDVSVELRSLFPTSKVLGLSKIVENPSTPKRLVRMYYREYFIKYSMCVSKMLKGHFRMSNCRSDQHLHLGESDF
jgi:hypothetical protein